MPGALVVAVARAGLALAAVMVLHITKLYMVVFMLLVFFFSSVSS
jgi:hypothetical protein